MHDAEVASDGWSLLRRDRATYAGGVLLAARPGLSVRRRPELESDRGEDLWVSFTIEQTIFNICVVYIPPKSPESVYLHFFQNVESLIDSLKGTVLIVGDLNLNPLYTSINILSYYCYFTTVCRLTEMNEVKNAYGGTLDVVLLREQISKVTEIDGNGLVPHRDLYHPPLDITIPVINSIHRSSTDLDYSNVDTGRDWNFAKGDYLQLYQLVSEVPWQKLFEIQNVDGAVESFYESLYNIFDICVPKKSRPDKSRRRYPVWFTGDIITDLRRKADLHRDWKCSGNRDTYAAFSKLRAELKQRVAAAHDIYLCRIQQNLKKNPRAFWQHIDSLKSKGGFEPNVTFQGRDFTGRNAADAFSNFFSSVFLPVSPLLDHDETIRQDDDGSANYVTIHNISTKEVEEGISRLKPLSSLGPDNVPAFILKGLKEQLSVPLQHLFNLALATGTYPADWKVSRVRPIPKTSGATDVENYRPIAILPTIAKLFESILHRTISSQLKPYLCDSQHGFRSNRSVETNLLTLVDLISEHLDKGIQVDVLYFDFKKAFDRVDNDVLLRKLCKIGFSPKLLKLFSSYLRDRRQYVRHGHFVSSPYHTRSGVSQGSILGPLLFGIMVNDLPSVARSAKCLLYADDLKLIYGIEQPTDCESLQDDVDRIFQWSVENKLLFNPAKCCVTTFSRSKLPIHARYMLGTEPVTRVDSVKDLGVTFDTQLTFHEHIKALAVNCYKRLGFVIRNARDFTDQAVIKLVYSALVRSKLEAASIIWNPYEVTYTLLLEKVQKAFLRFLYKKSYGYYPFLYPTKFLLGVLGLNSLEVRRNHTLLTTACSVLRGNSDCPELVAGLVSLFVPPIPKYTFRPRRHDLLAVPSARTVSHRNSPLIRALRYLNALLAAAPDCDVFADGWLSVRIECLKYCERMEDDE